MRTTGLLLAVTMAGWVLMTQPGCGGGAKTPVAAKPDTTAPTGAVCATTLAPDSTSTAAAVAPTDTAPKPPAPDKPAKVAERPKELPKMWDFGSTTCLPCKTMLGILTPMLTDYKGKVDVRIINVYEETELTKQFRISVIPTQVFIDAAGKELYRHIGVYPRDSIEACFMKFSFPVVPSTAPPTQTPATGGT